MRIAKEVLKKLPSKLRANKPLVFIIGFAAVGILALVLTRAAAPNASLEAEAGVVSGLACVENDSNASNNSAVKFGSCNNGGSLNLPRIPWEGGHNYWKAANGPQFAKANAAGWDDPSFFPIAVFYGKPDTSHVNSLKDAGINILAPVEDAGPLTTITNVSGMYAMPLPSEFTQTEAGSNSGVVGWFISDECEMIIQNCPGYQAGDDGENVALSRQTAEVNRVRAYNDGRFVHANYGNGILRTFWATSTMSQFVQLLDSSSADKYTYTSPHVADIIDGFHDAPDWPNGVPVPRAYSYGWQADQMKRFQDPNSPRPIWAFVETAMPYLGEPGAREITRDQIEGAVWSALRHEARGVYYFQHNGFSATSCTATYSIVDCPAVHAAVKDINQKVLSLAPVLNTQSYANATRNVNGFTYQYYTFNNGTDAMLKTYQGYAYIFAGLGMRCNQETCTSGTVDATGSKTFTLPAGVNGTSVEVVGENRTIPISNRTFTDNFAAEYTHHVYKITL